MNFIAVCVFLMNGMAGTPVGDEGGQAFEARL
jgi:hypothetical protein